MPAPTSSRRPATTCRWWTGPVSGRAHRRGTPAGSRMSHCYPVPSPGSVRAALRSAGRADAPLYVRPSVSPRLLRWLYEFQKYCRPAAFARGASALSALAEPTEKLFDNWRGDGVDTTLTRPGLVHAFLDEREAERTLALQRSLANGLYRVPDAPLAGTAIQRLEPSLSDRVRAAYVIEDEGLVNPVAAHLVPGGPAVVAGRRHQPTVRCLGVPGRERAGPGGCGQRRSHRLRQRRDRRWDLVGRRAREAGSAPAPAGRQGLQLRRRPRRTSDAPAVPRREARRRLTDRRVDPDLGNDGVLGQQPTARLAADPGDRARRAGSTSARGSTPATT